MIIHKKSHVHFGLGQDVLDYCMVQLKDRTGFFIETLEIPPFLGKVYSFIYGPVCGDPPIGDNEVYFKQRPGRSTVSRMVRRPARLTNKVTVIAGPYEGYDCVLYTIYGGPAAEKELNDPTITTKEELNKSVFFWSQHALAEEPG